MGKTRKKYPLHEYSNSILLSHDACSLYLRKELKNDILKILDTHRT